MSDTPKVQRVSLIEYHDGHGYVRNNMGTHAFVEWETWELSKSHFIEMDKKLGQLQHALGEAQRKSRMPYSKFRIEP